MLLIHAIILGIIEGVTEFLPISSTGHLILASALLGIPETDFVKTFEITIQLGAIAAVVVLFWRRFLDVQILGKLFVAFLPTGIIGFLLYKLLKSYLIGNEWVVLWALGLGGVTLIAFEFWHKERPGASDDMHKITYLQAFLIGLIQSISIIPGVSRSAATILGGLSLGIKRVTIVEFSFLLAVPTMIAATGYDLYKSATLFTVSDLGILLIGVAVSFIAALFSIRYFLTYIRTRCFVPFGIYRIGVALLFLLFIIH